METNQGVLSGWRQSRESAVTAVAGILSSKEDKVSDEHFPPLPKAPPGQKANMEWHNQTSISTPGTQRQLENWYPLLQQKILTTRGSKLCFTFQCLYLSEVVWFNYYHYLTIYI